MDKRQILVAGVFTLSGFGLAVTGIVASAGQPPAPPGPTSLVATTLLPVMPTATAPGAARGGPYPPLAASEGPVVTGTPPADLVSTTPHAPDQG